MVAGGRLLDHRVEDVAIGSSLSSLLLSSLGLSQTKVYAPEIRARLGTTVRFREAVVLELRAVPVGTALNFMIIRVILRGEQAMYKLFEPRGWGDRLSARDAANVVWSLATLRHPPSEVLLHPTPCTLHPAPCTLHPEPCTLSPAPCTLHPAP